MVINLRGGGGGDLKGGQQQHQITKGSALVIGGNDLLQLCLADAPYLQKPLRFILQHMQCICAKPVYDQLGGLAANALDKPRGKIPLDPFAGLRYDLLTFRHMQLKAVFTLFPLAVQYHADLIGARQLIAHGGKMDHIVPMPVRAASLFWDRTV